MNKYIWPICMAAIISLGIGNYSKNATGSYSNALISGSLVFIITIVLLFIIFKAGTIKKKYITNRDWHKIGLINTVLFVISVLYVMLLEYVHIKFADQVYFGTIFNIIVLMIILILFIIIFISEYRKCKEDSNQ